MDKRKLWREQERLLVERWNAAATRYGEVQSKLALQGAAADAALRLEAEAARSDMETVRRQVARLKVEFTSGKRY